MKPLPIISLLLIWIQAYSQNIEIINLVFTDKSNFDITTSLDNKRPSKFFVLNMTDKWNSYRFHLKDDIKSDSVRKKISLDEHHPYNYSYLFKDSILNQLFNSTEKEHLYRLSQTIKPRQLSEGFNVFLLIKSFHKIKDGFFFSITDPIFSSDNQFAFLDLTTHKKNKGTKEFNDAYFGKTLLLYQNIKGKGWTRIKKIDYLIL